MCCNSASKSAISEPSIYVIYIFLSELEVEVVVMSLILSLHSTHRPFGEVDLAADDPGLGIVG